MEGSTTGGDENMIAIPSDIPDPPSKVTQESEERDDTLSIPQTISFKDLPVSKSERAEIPDRGTSSDLDGTKSTSNFNTDDSTLSCPTRLDDNQQNSENIIDADRDIVVAQMDMAIEDGRIEHSDAIGSCAHLPVVFTSILTNGKSEQAKEICVATTAMGKLDCTSNVVVGNPHEYAVTFSENVQEAIPFINQGQVSNSQLEHELLEMAANHNFKSRDNIITGVEILLISTEQDSGDEVTEGYKPAGSNMEQDQKEESTSAPQDPLHNSDTLCFNETWREGMATDKLPDCNMTQDAPQTIHTDEDINPAFLEQVPEDMHSNNQADSVEMQPQEPQDLTPGSHHQSQDAATAKQSSIQSKSRTEESSKSSRDQSHEDVMMSHNKDDIMDKNNLPPSNVQVGGNAHFSKPDEAEKLNIPSANSSSDAIPMAMDMNSDIGVTSVPYTVLSSDILTDIPLLATIIAPLDTGILRRDLYQAPETRAADATELNLGKDKIKIYTKDSGLTEIMDELQEQGEGDIDDTTIPETAPGRYTFKSAIQEECIFVQAEMSCHEGQPITMEHNPLHVEDAEASEASTRPESSTHLMSFKSTFQTEDNPMGVEFEAEAAHQQVINTPSSSVTPSVVADSNVALSSIAQNTPADSVHNNNDMDVMAGIEMECSQQEIKNLKVPLPNGFSEVIRSAPGSIDHASVLAMPKLGILNNVDNKDELMSDHFVTQEKEPLTVAIATSHDVTKSTPLFEGIMAEIITPSVSIVVRDDDFSALPTGVKKTAEGQNQSSWKGLEVSAVAGDSENISEMAPDEAQDSHKTREIVIPDSDEEEDDDENGIEEILDILPVHRESLKRPTSPDEVFQTLTIVPILSQSTEPEADRTPPSSPRVETTVSSPQVSAKTLVMSSKPSTISKNKDTQYCSPTKTDTVSRFQVKAGEQISEGSGGTKDAVIEELKAMKIASLKARNAALVAEIASKRDKLAEVSKTLNRRAAETVKRHIKLLHDYNDIRDVGQGLIGMIADNRGVRIGDLYEEFGVDVKD